jgi:hypothetical protein
MGPAVKVIGLNRLNEERLPKEPQSAWTTGGMTRLATCLNEGRLPKEPR